MAGIELFYIFIVMLAVFVILLVLLKVPAGISLMVSAIVGALIAGFGIPIRHLVEGTFGFIDPIKWTIACGNDFYGHIRKKRSHWMLVVWLLLRSRHKYPNVGY